MIKSIDWEVMSNGRGTEPLWFHPRACTIPATLNAPSSVFMTAQGISGSDYFHPVQWMRSEDIGASWSVPSPVPGFDRHDFPDSKEFGRGVQEGICDAVPEYHRRTGRILCIGHTVFYQNGKFFLPQPDRHPAYNVFDPVQKTWRNAVALSWRDDLTIFTSGCAQRHTLDNGDILLPLSFRNRGDTAAKVTTALMSFDGESCRIKTTGTELELDVNRGLLEPTICKSNGRYYLTIRAEDDRGYRAVSDDGLTWREFGPWCWDDRTPLTMSTTQSRWLPHSDGLFLVYVRKDPLNRNVMRWRAPLYVSRVDPDTMMLIRDTEQIVVPLRGDGIGDPDMVARLGNFHTVAVTHEESWVTVGEAIPKDDWKGDTIISRIRWKQQNRNLIETGE